MSKAIPIAVFFLPGCVGTVAGRHRADDIDSALVAKYDGDSTSAFGVGPHGRFVYHIWQSGQKLTGYGRIAPKEWEEMVDRLGAIIEDLCREPVARHKSWSVLLFRGDHIERRDGIPLEATRPGGKYYFIERYDNECRNRVDYWSASSPDQPIEPDAATPGEAEGSETQ